MMKYASMDIETLGRLIKKPSRILQISIVVEDVAKANIPLLELPHFTFFVAQEEYTGEPGALSMHGWIFKELDTWEKSRFKVTKNPTKYPVYFEREFIAPLREFLDKHFGTYGGINVAGKNVGGFDVQFLPPDIQDWFRSNVIDVGSVFIDWKKDRIPWMGQLCKDLGVEEEGVHDAYTGALKNIELLRKSYPTP